MESSRSQGNADGASSLTGSRVCSSAAGWGVATSLPQHPANLGQFLLPTATQQRERAPNPVGEEWEGRGGCRAWPRRPIEDLGPECSLKDPTFSSKADRGQQVRDEFFARKTNLKLSLTCLCGRVIRCSPAFGEEEVGVFSTDCNRLDLHSWDCTERTAAVAGPAAPHALATSGAATAQRDDMFLRLRCPYP